jgi:hypothetical protein
VPRTVSEQPIPKTVKGADFRVRNPTIARSVAYEKNNTVLAAEVVVDHLRQIWELMIWVCLDMVLEERIFIRTGSANSESRNTELIPHVKVGANRNVSQDASETGMATDSIPDYQEWNRLHGFPF